MKLRIRISNIFWMFLHDKFKIYKPCPKELLDFDEIYAERK